MKWCGNPLLYIYVMSVCVRARARVCAYVCASVVDVNHMVHSAAAGLGPRNASSTNS